MPSYSIIVPVYNAEKHLEKCIISILRQSFTDFELIIVDDGSKDSSLLICNRYASSDKRIRIIQKENGGVSSARNRGLEESNGQKILFVDADDFVDSELLAALEQNKSELTVYNSFTNTDATITVDKKTIDYDFLCGDLGKIILFSPWNKAYDSKIIRDNSLMFDEKVKIGEDMLFNLEYLKNISKIKVLKSQLYRYVIHEDSAMNNLKKDYLPDYKVTLSSLIQKITYNERLICSWCFDIVPIILVRKFLSEKKHKDFKKYLNAFKENDLYHYASKCKEKKSFSKKIMFFLLKHNLYSILHLAIKTRIK